MSLPSYKYWFDTGFIKVGDEFLWSPDGQTEFQVYDPVSGYPTGETVKYVYRGPLVDGKPSANGNEAFYATATPCKPA